MRSLNTNFNHFSVSFFPPYTQTAARRGAMLQTASIASGATLALFLVLVLCLVFYVRWHQQQKKERYDAHEENGYGVDTVDGLECVRSGGLPDLRPFGPHHQKFIPLAETFSSR